MFSLVSGFLQTYVFAKTEINIIILGLDGAGKTVSLGMSGIFSPDRLDNLLCRFYYFYLLQTLLERMKSIFKKMPGIPPERIPPTIGLNGEPPLS